MPFNAQDIWLAAYLAIFHVTLAASRTGIDRRLVPLAAARALEARVHISAKRDSLLAKLFVYKSSNQRLETLSCFLQHEILLSVGPV